MDELNQQNNNHLPKRVSIPVAIALIILVLFVVGYVFRESLQDVPIIGFIIPDDKPDIPPIKVTVKDFKKFDSEEEYKSYINDAAETYSGGGRILGMGVPAVGADFAAESLMSLNSARNKTAPAAPSMGGGGGTPDRYSETNVQVVGIDEPDILKTNGTEIFFSPNAYYYRDLPMPLIDEPGITRPEYKGPTTRLIKAFPVDQLAEEGEIDENGNLLLFDDVLVIFYNGGREILGYDVSDPEDPEELWKVKLDNRNSFVQARSYDDKIYLVTRTNTYRGGPCPIPMYEVRGEKISVRCTDVYHPSIVVPVNATYNVSTIDPKDGDLTEGISFVGSYSSTVYMSSKSIYIAYSYQGDYVKFMYGFFKENDDIMPSETIERLEKLLEYDISQTAKLAELQVIMEEYMASLSGDDELRLENELVDRMEEYLTEHKRELLLTDIVKVAVDDFDIEARGVIPGRLLNQFSLDEYKDHLRTAVTVGERFGWGGRSLENDVYVLDENLKITGSVQGLGLDESIYSARFVEDKGYLVTFRRIDPFYVLDLSDPDNPEMKGELKIPGYSSYLHPINKDKILGIGKEGSQVKISLFDVSDPENPKEADKYSLKEYWSDILSTHHAFLLDSKHQIFFMPGNQGGYVFTYKGDDLKLIKAVSGIRARRALFIDDYLYIAGDNEIVVLDENSWERVKELDL